MSQLSHSDIEKICRYFDAEKEKMDLNLIYSFIAEPIPKIINKSDLKGRKDKNNIEFSDAFIEKIYREFSAQYHNEMNRRTMEYRKQQSMLHQKFIK